MTSTTGSKVSRRRPPAIEPVRKVLRIDVPAASHAPHLAEPTSAELPNVVLRLPEIRSDLPIAMPGAPAVPPLLANDRLKIVCVAAVLVLLAVLFFSSAEQPGSRAIEPLSPTPLAPAAAAPDQQCAPPWQVPVVSLPPVPDVTKHSVGADRPVYRTADRSAAGGDHSRQPSVRFEGSIEKQTPDIRYERP